MEDLFPEASATSAAADADGVRYARIAVERGIDAHDGSLTYRVGDEPVAVGDRVLVPLGRGDRKAAGVVVEVGGETLLAGLSPSRIKPIYRRSGSALPESLVTLARWMAEYYVCPLGMVLATMMPAAVKKAIGRSRRIEVQPASEAEAEAILAAVKLTPTVREAWEGIRAMEAAAFPMPARDLAGRLAKRSVAPLNRLVKLGLLRQVEREVVKSRTSPWEELAIHGPPPEPIVPSADQARVVAGLVDSLGGFGVHLLRGVTGSGKTEVYLRVIEQVLRDEKGRVARAACPPVEAAGAKALADKPPVAPDGTLSPGERVRGKTALVLVPEIALTPQTAGRFLERFGSQGVAVLHSGLSAAERHRQWALAAGGGARVVVGARSAVFAPLPNLGLIVVDEEHDGSYKQDQLPRYHARDVAIMRGKTEGCPVVLGSATPSLESWSKVGRRDGGTAGRRDRGTGTGSGGGGSRYWHLWELDERVGGARLPHVEVVDLVEERKARAMSAQGSGGRFHLLGPRLEEALRQTLEAGDGSQAILLLNRRGYAGYISCPDQRCGWIMGCIDCDARMVLHRHRDLPVGGVMRCHHCLAEMKMPKHCPLCGLRPIALGMGTQQLEEELVEKFGEHGLQPGDTLLRVDSDTMRTAKDYFHALAGFGAGRVRVLVGTQMIAKGLDFPNVRLVGVVNADTALSIPDFRATERTFQLVSQVAGRAGRSTDPGRVIVQTMGPQTPAIWHASRHDYRSFADEELAIRREAGLPPVTRMARVIVRDEDYHQAMGLAEKMAKSLRSATTAGMAAGGGPVRIVGPMPCPISRIAGQFRVAIELTAAKPSDLHRPLDLLRREGLLKSDAATAVDVDPVALM